MKDAFENPHPIARVSAAGADIAYVDTGARDGTPVVFLHGNPTSSYLWRNVIPHAAGAHRCLAPDLAGMGNSGPSRDGHYRFLDHVAVIDAWFDAVLPQGKVVLVVHDWGSAIGFHWARRNPERVAAIAYMEAITMPRLWSDFPDGRDKLFRRLRAEEGASLVLEQNFFVETVLPKSILRQLTEPEMAAYRAPYPDAETRVPTLIWPRELPIEGEPADVVAAVEAYAAFMAAAPFPKLFINAEPGAITVGRARDICRTWPNQREVTVKGVHFVQEDSAEEIGAALSAFLERFMS